MLRLKPIFALMLVLFTPVFADEIRGTVTTVQQDGTVRVKLEESQGAMAGDAVRIIWKLGGETLEVRGGVVAHDGQGTVMVRLAEGENTVSPSMTAVIDSSGKPSKSTEADPGLSKTVTTGSSRKSSIPQTPIDTEFLTRDWSPMSPEDQVFAANMFFDLGTKKFEAEEWQRAFEHLQASALHGHQKAPGYVGYLMDHGLGTKKDSPESVRWFLLGEERNDPFAISALAKIYSEGKEDRYSVARDKRAAFERYRRAADLGDVVAMRETGWFLQKGIGTEEDWTMALQYYRKAAEGGSAVACNDVGVFYREGLGGIEADQTQASKWFARAAEKGLSFGMFNLGESYRLGRGVEKDLEQAESWYRMAMEGGGQAETLASDGLKKLQAERAHTR